MRFEMALSALNKKCGSICAVRWRSRAWLSSAASLRGFDLAAAPHLKLAIRKDHDQDEGVGDQVLLQFVEAAQGQRVAEIVGFTHERVDGLANRDDAGDMHRGKHQRPGRMSEQRAPPGSGVQSESSLEAHDQRNARNDDERAAHFPNEGLPGREAAVVNHLIDAQVRSPNSTASSAYNIQLVRALRRGIVADRIVAVHGFLERSGRSAQPICGPGADANISLAAHTEQGLQGTYSSDQLVSHKTGRGGGHDQQADLPREAPDAQAAMRGRER
jgi:hypothetical protein